jgi:hypothetical protein
VAPPGAALRIAVDPRGTVTVLVRPDGGRAPRVARFDSGGALDPAFAGAGVLALPAGEPGDLALAPDGSLAVASTVFGDGFITGLGSTRAGFSTAVSVAAWSPATVRRRDTGEVS